MPVRKLPRRKWCIPRIDEAERIKQDFQEEERLKRLAEGTTPHGRELLRKIVWSAEQLLRNETQTESEVIDLIRSELHGFQELRLEWGLLLSRIFRVKDDTLREMSPALLAHIVVRLAKNAVQREKMNESPTWSYPHSSMGTH